MLRAVQQRPTTPQYVEDHHNLDGLMERLTQAMTRIRRANGRLESPCLGALLSSVPELRHRVAAISL